MILKKSNCTLEKIELIRYEIMKDKKVLGMKKTFPTDLEVVEYALTFTSQVIAMQTSD